MNTNIRIANRIFIRHSPFIIRFSLFVFANCQLLTANCQNDILKYAHQIVDTLASPSMYGRGYVMKGDSIAADYIKNQFEEIGMKPIGKEFYQRFSFPVNTFPGDMEVKLGKQKLIPGKDYIMNENSGGGKGKMKIKFIKTSPREYKGGGAQIFLDSTFFTLNNSKYILIFPKSKLTADLSQINSPLIVIDIKDSLIKQIRKKIKINITNQFTPNYQSQNVIGYIKGTQYPDSFLVFTAHYDHLGMMGKDVCFPGANDNASGCAMLLNLARYYSQHPPKYSVAFMAFGAEEVGLLGSKYYIKNQLFNINQIKFLINFDIVGTGDEGIKVVDGAIHKKEFDELVQINNEKKYLPSIQPRGKAAISDHYFFEESGVKSFYIYTLGGIKAYHDIYDRPETLPLTKFEELYKLVIDFSDTLQK